MACVHQEFCSGSSNFLEVGKYTLQLSIGGNIAIPGQFLQVVGKVHCGFNGRIAALSTQGVYLASVSQGTMDKSSQS